MKPTEKQRFYLCRYAALQFPGAIDNYSTQHPIHLLEEKTGAYESMSLSEYDEDEVALIEYGDDGYKSFNTIEELVADFLCLDCHNENDIKEYNDAAKKDNDVLFVSYSNAARNGSIPGCENEIYDVEDYLKAYGISPDEVSLYRLPDSFEVKAVSFTHKGAKELEKELVNHISKPTRFYAFTTCDGDFPVLMDFLYQYGKVCLEEDNADMQWNIKSRMLPEEVKQHFNAKPNERVCIADYSINFENTRELNGVFFRHANIRVFANGEIRSHEKGSYPVGSLNVVMNCEKANFECKYPFECDVLGTSLDADDSAKVLFNYMFYSNV